MSFFKTKKGEKEGFTGNKDVDSEISLKMDDRSYEISPTHGQLQVINLIKLSDL